MSHDALTDARPISTLKQRARQTHIILVALCLLTLGTRVGYAFITPIDAAHDEWDHIATKLALGQGYASSWPKTYIQPAYLNIPDYQFPLLPTATRVPVPVFYFALMYRQTSKAMFDRRFGSVAVVETADDTQLLIDRTYREEAMAKLLEYPGRYIILSLVRGLRLWFNVGYGHPLSLASVSDSDRQPGADGANIQGVCVISRRLDVQLVPAFVVMVQHTLTHMAIVGAFRYSVPLMPYLFMTGSYALVRLLEGKGIRHGNRIHLQEWRGEH